MEVKFLSLLLDPVEKLHSVSVFLNVCNKDGDFCYDCNNIHSICKKLLMKLATACNNILLASK
jgi:hypothetical protein